MTTKRVMPKGKPFPKGVSGNPLGGKMHNKELKAIRRLTAVEVAEIGGMILQNNLAALKAIAKDPDASVLKTMIASVAVKTIEKGDAHALDKLLDRLIGKVRDEIKVTSVGNPLVTAQVVVLPSNGREKK